MKISKFTKISVSAIAVLMSAGCASVEGFPKRFETVETVIQELDAQYNTKTVLANYDKAADQKAYRNQVIAARKMVIDMQFAELQKNMFSQRSYMTVGGDTLKSVFNAAGALTTAGQTSQILSGLTGAFDAASTSVDSNVYQSQTQIAVMSMMRAERAVVRLRIQERSKQDASTYPLASALSDLEAYYMAGSVPGALAAITANAGEKQADAEAQIENSITPDADLAKRAKSVTELAPSLAKLTDADVTALLQTPPAALPTATTDRLKLLGVTSFTGLSADKSRFALRQILDNLATNDVEGKTLDAWQKKIIELAK